jgi:hypothetical protein
MSNYVEDDVDPEAEAEIESAIARGAPHAVVWGEILGHDIDIFELDALPHDEVTTAAGWALHPLYSNELIDGWGVAFVGVKDCRVRLLSLRTASGQGFDPTATTFQSALGDAVDRAARSVQSRSDE